MSDVRSQCTGGITCPCDRCASLDREEYCTRLSWCSLYAGHEGECVVLGSQADRELPDWDRTTRDPTDWRKARRNR